MKATIFFILLVLLTGLNFAQDQYEIASDAIKKNDFNTALQISQRLLSHDSTDQAIKILVELTSHDSTDKGGYISLGDAYSKMSVLELALEDYRHAERIDSLDIQIKFKIAEALYKQKSYTDAANKYLQVIAIDSNNIQAYDKLGELLYYAAEYPNAAFYLTKYLKYDQKNSKVYYFAANSLFKMQNYDGASNVAEEGLQNFPQNNDLKRLDALSLSNLKRADAAAKIAGSTPDSLFTGRDDYIIGISLLNADKDSIAVIFLKRAMDKDTSLINNIADLVATSYFRTGSYDSAIVYYNNKIKADPANFSANINKGICLSQLKNYNEASTTLAEAVQLKPDYIPAVLWLARAYRNIKDSSDEAAAAFRKVITLSKGTEDSHKDELSEAYGYFAITDLLKKRYAPAIESLKSALTYKPDDSMYHLWLAQAYVFTNKNEDAIREYKKVLSLDPKNADAKKGLKLLTN
jgi:tetratricopeptide (TPR) repeat protein